jgi:hypothetical protein
MEWLGKFVADAFIWSVAIAPDAAIFVGKVALANAVLLLTAALVYGFVLDRRERHRSLQAAHQQAAGLDERWAHRNDD